ncbi:MAG: hypothetical protein EZS28_002255, partial [Streblomastix strix]
MIPHSDQGQNIQFISRKEIIDSNQPPLHYEPVQPQTNLNEPPPNWVYRDRQLYDEPANSSIVWPGFIRNHSLSAGKSEAEEQTSIILRRDFYTPLFSSLVHSPQFAAILSPMGLSKPGENVLHFLSTSTALSAIFTLPLENDCVGIIVRRVGNTLIIESVEETDE